MRALLGAAVLVATVGCARSSIGRPRRARVENRSLGHDTRHVRGAIYERKTGAPIHNDAGLIIAQCEQTDTPYEAGFDERGRFELRDLPAGPCDILVLFGSGEYARRLTLQPGERVELRIGVPPSEMPRFYRN